MSKALEKLKAIISKSDLSPEDQNDLLIFLPILPNQVLAELNKVFETKPKMLREFNENFKAKIAVLASANRDSDAWEEIVEQETGTFRKTDEEDINDNY